MVFVIGMCSRAPLSTYAKHVFGLSTSARLAVRTAVGETAWKVIRRQLDTNELDEANDTALADDMLLDKQMAAAEAATAAAAPTTGSSTAVGSGGSDSKAAIAVKDAKKSAAADDDEDEEFDDDEEEEEHDADALGAGLYVLGCCMNHSCVPNVQLYVMSSTY